MTYEQIRDEVAKYSYRPGWRMSVHPDPVQAPLLYILAEVHNAYRPGEAIQLRIASRIPPMRDRDALDRWMSWRLCQIEVHESMEWLRRDGKPIFDPHADLDPV